MTNKSWQEQVYYDTDPSQPYYNGNIARSTWTYNGITKGYMYLYDGLNRLTDSNYGEGSSLTTNPHLQDEDFSYDKMGNVTSIYRKNQGTVIDNVTLQYTGNHLKKGTDAAGASTLYGITEYTDDADTIPEFYYDANGNLTADLDKNIAAIRYNVVNLPDTIQFGNGRQIINSYDAGGHKLTTQYYTPIGTVIVPKGGIHGGYTTANSVLLLDDYCGSYLYENGTSASVHPLTKILTPEGYVDMSTSGYPYCYYKQDHLGSNREVTSYSGTTGTVVQQTEYYPSGTAYVEGTGVGVQPFKFTGKELIIMHGLNWQDYGARWLDNVRMEWTTLDPLCEKYYWITPYAYCLDNPVRLIDPKGKNVYNINQNTGEIEIVKTKDQSHSYYIVDGKGNRSFVGSFAYNKKGLVQLPKSLNFNNLQGNNVGFSVKSGSESKSFVSANAMASLIGTVANANVKDLTINQFSNADGSSPAPSVSHKNGTNGDLRYLRTDDSGGSVVLGSPNVDVNRQNTLNDALSSPEIGLQKK